MVAMEEDDPGSIVTDHRLVSCPIRQPVGLEDSEYWNLGSALPQWKLLRGSKEYLRTSQGDLLRANMDYSSRDG
jgi:hypothetical protein